MVEKRTPVPVAIQERYCKIKDEMHLMTYSGKITTTSRKMISLRR